MNFEPSNIRKINSKPKATPTAPLNSELENFAHRSPFTTPGTLLIPLDFASRCIKEHRVLIIYRKIIKRNGIHREEQAKRSHIPTRNRVVNFSL